jgi:hypothetical protein
MLTGDPGRRRLSVPAPCAAQDLADVTAAVLGSDVKHRPAPKYPEHGAQPSRASNCPGMGATAVPCLATRPDPICGHARWVPRRLILTTSTQVGLRSSNFVTSRPADR